MIIDYVHLLDHMLLFNYGNFLLYSIKNKTPVNQIFTRVYVEPEGDEPHKFNKLYYFS